MHHTLAPNIGQSGSVRPLLSKKITSAVASLASFLLLSTAPTLAWKAIENPNGSLTLRHTETTDITLVTKSLDKQSTSKSKGSVTVGILCIHNPKFNAPTERYVARADIIMPVALGFAEFRKRVSNSVELIGFTGSKGLMQKCVLSFDDAQFKDQMY